MSQLPFTHLHLHTEYSLLDGANKIKLLIKRAKELGMTSIAMSDHGNMFGAIEFYQTCKKEGVKPIIGLEAYLHNSEDIGDKSTRQRFHLCLFAKNEVGYKNLMFLSSKAYMEGFYYYPRINKQLLKEHSEGLICTSACLQGEVQWHLNDLTEKKKQFGAKGYGRALEVALEYKEIFGEDFYLEMMRHGIEEQRYIDEQTIRLSLETGIKIIATNDTHYLKQQDADAHEVFMCISTNTPIADKGHLHHSVKEFYLKSPTEIATLYADIPEALLNTQEIVDKCNLELKLGNPTPPSFKFTKEYATAQGLDFENDAEFFAYICREGLKERLKLVPEGEHETYRARLEREIEVITKMKFPGYMLIVWDFVREAKEKGIPVGPGRGSAAGSLVAYCLKITDIDPLKYNLLFERFLNPERVSMPDIDMDFCQERREEIIDYVVRKYGRNNVAQVITFGTLLAKGVIRDVSRILGVEYAKADAMAKLIPEKIGITLEEAFELEPKIKELTESDSTAKKVWEYALLLEGLKRNAGTHAAAVVIDSEKELWHKTPLYKPSNEETLATGYSMKYLEDVDLIKFDFLGLKTLTVINEALKLIKSRYGMEIDFNATDVNDPKVYATIQSGHTLGLFQIESDGMQDLNRRLKPTCFEDIIAVLALYRPGPMGSGMVDDFINRKHGREAITYPFDVLKDILEPTYGVIVYQEQVMQIVQTIGGFSLGKSDLVRRAMGKKIKEEMDKLRGEFADGAQKCGFDGKKAADLFDLITKFAEYGFNKSHSAAYAMITFQTAYLKTYYPQEFMAALLTSEQDNTDKIVEYIDEVKRLGISVLPPNINRSNREFVADRVDGVEAILFGLGAIKGVGGVAIDIILEERTKKPFESLSDLLNRIDPQKVNKKVLESLIKCGALDGFLYSRRAMLEQVESIVEAAQKAQEAQKMAVNSLFGDSDELTVVTIEIEHMQEYDMKKILEFERETLGFYVSGHPLDIFREDMREIKYTLSSQLDEIADGSEAMFVGIVEEIESKVSKKSGKKLNILYFLDLHGTLEIMIYEELLRKIEAMDRSRPIALKTVITRDNQFTRIRVLKALTLEEARGERVKTEIVQKIEEDEIKPPITVRLNLDSEPKKVEELYALSQKYTGRSPLNILFVSKLSEVMVETGVMVSENILEEFEAA